MCRRFLFFLYSLTITSCIFIGQVSGQTSIIDIIPARDLTPDFRQYLTGDKSYTIDSTEIQAIFSSKPDKLSLSIPVEREMYIGQLHKKDLASQGYRLTNSDNILIENASLPIYYEGNINNDPQAKIHLVIYKKKIHMRFAQEKSYRLTPHKNNHYVLRSGERKSDKTFFCGVIDEDISIAVSVDDYNREVKTSRNSSGDTVLIYIEVANNIFYQLGEDYFACQVWAFDLFGEVQSIYAQSNVPIKISGIKIWDQQEPYSDIYASDVFDDFLDSLATQGFSGHIATFWSGSYWSDAGGVGSLTALCGCDRPVSICGNLDTYVTPLPDYSYSVQVITHELGHNFGLYHTHACVWNGNNTQIDDCGAVYGSIEGAACSDPGNYIIPDTGTIMSYCDAIGNIIDLDRGFHPQVSDTLYQHYQSFISNPACQIICGLPCTEISYPQYGDTLVPSSFNLTWTNHPAVEGYIVSIGTCPDCTDVMDNIDVGNVTSIPLNLPACQDYYVKVSSYNNGTISGNCPVFYFKTEEDHPDCIALTSHQNGQTYTEENTVLSWTPSTNSTGYLLYLGSQSGMWDIVDGLYLEDNTYNCGPLGELYDEVYIDIKPLNNCNLNTSCLANNYVIYLQPAACNTLNLTLEGAEPSGNFGQSIDTDTDLVIIGAPNMDNGIDAGGVVQIYRSMPIGLHELDLLYDASTDVFDDYGYDVGISGTDVVVGSKGKAYLYHESNDSWVLDQVLTYNSSNTFGTAVAISGDHLVIGDYTRDNEGAVHMYIFSNGSWSETGILTPPVSTFGQDDFGLSVDLEGNRLIIGAPGAGKVFFYYYNNGQWQYDNSFSVPNTSFGNDVAIDDIYAIAGVPDASYNGQTTGAALTFLYLNNNWEITDTLGAPDPHQNDQFGQSVAIDHRYALVGAPGKDYYNGNYTFAAGGAYKFRRITLHWEVKEVIENSDTEATLMGKSCALAPEALYVGIPNSYTSNLPSKVYHDFCSDLPPCTSLIYPANGQLNVPIDSIYYWNMVADAEGYKLIAGTSLQSSDILDTIDVGAVTSYEYMDLPPGDTIYWSVIPYNAYGHLQSCETFFFVTRPLPACPQNTIPPDQSTDIPIMPNLLWDPVPDADGYIVDVGSCMGCKDVLDSVMVIGQTTFSLPVLSYSTDYYYSVRSFNDSGISNCTESSFTTVDPPIVVPSCAVITSPLEFSVTDINHLIQWNQSTAATGYKLLLINNNDTLLNNFDVGNVLEYLVMDLPYNSILDLKVSPYNNDTINMACTSIYFQTIPLPIPDCVTPTYPAGNGDVVLVDSSFSWHPSPHADGYRVSAGYYPSYNDLADNIDVGVDTFFSPGILNYNAFINLKITPYNANGEPLDCPTLLFQTEYFDPGCTQLWYPPNGATNVNRYTDIRWNGTGTPYVDGYKIIVGSCAGCNDILDTLDIGNVLSYQPPAFDYEDTVYVQVIPYNAFKQNEECMVTSFVIEDDPRPGCLSLTSPTHMSTEASINTTLIWSLAGGVDGYRLSVGNCAGCRNIVNDLDLGFTNFYDLGGQITYEDSIWVEIQPYNQSGISDCMEEWFVVEDYPEAPCPTLIFPTDGLHDIEISPTLSWTIDPQATGYKIRMGTAPGGNDVLDTIDLGYADHYIPLNLTEGQQIFWSIIPYNQVGDITSTCGEYSFMVECPSCATCSDGVMNNDEENIDCGGSNCLPCNNCNTDFYDDGGLNRKHAYLDTLTWVLCPDGPDHRLMLTFHQWDLGSSATTRLKVYDGINDTGILRNNITGNGNNLTEIVSMDNTGCLTVVLESADAYPGEGWIAETNCIDRCGIVNNPDNSGHNSLREAITCSENGDTITFSPEIHGDTVHLSSSLSIYKELHIQGPADPPVYVSAQSIDYLVSSGNSTDLTIENLYLLAGEGGAFYIFGFWQILPRAFINNGHITLKNCTIEDYPFPYDSRTMLIQNNGILRIEGDSRLKK